MRYKDLGVKFSSKLSDLTSKLKDVLSKCLQRPSQPPVKVGELEAPEGDGVKSSELYKKPPSTRIAPLAL